MKKLTCKDLGGTCGEEFTGETFEEIGAKSQSHVTDQIMKGEGGHKAAAEVMKNASGEQQKAMMEEFRRKFDAAPEA